MSRETSQWLNTRTLQGFVEERGHAWHYDPEAQGDASNHYPQAIPVNDVNRRLFSWTPAEYPVTAGPVTDHGRKGIVRPAGTFGDDDPGAILGVFKKSYRVHGYTEWLVETMETVLDDGLQVASAGLLRGGAVAWVQAQLPETLVAPGQYEFRPFITAATSLDGTLQTTYITGAQAVVCDNTLSAGLNSAASTVKKRHTAKSLQKIGEVRDALGIVHQVADDFMTQVEALMGFEVSDAEVEAFFEAFAPTVDDKGQPKKGRGLTVAQNIQGDLKKLWIEDPRVAPWAGSAFGVVQMVNTFEHHGRQTRGQGTFERNMLRVVNDKVDEMDLGTLQLLQTITG